MDEKQPFLCLFDVVVCKDCVSSRLSTLNASQKSGSRPPVDVIALAEVIVGLGEETLHNPTCKQCFRKESCVVQAHCNGYWDWSSLNCVHPQPHINIFLAPPPPFKTTPHMHAPAHSKPRGRALRRTHYPPACLSIRSSTCKPTGRPSHCLGPTSCHMLALGVTQAPGLAGITATH